MKFRGTVNEIFSTGEGAEIVITNCRQKGAADWREYGKVAFKVTEAQSRAFYIGREIEIEIKLMG